MRSRFILALMTAALSFGCVAVQIPVPAPGSAKPYKLALKGAWYRAGRASFLAELTDPGPARQDAVADMLQNFEAMVAAGMNVAVVRMEDDDDWTSQFGGGAPYDPKNHPRDIAGAEKIILDTADAAGIHIVFVIGASGYHRILPNDVDGNPAGAYDYFNQFVLDPRVIGWLLFDECDPSNPQVQAFLTKYWDFVYERFHGPNTWVGINTVYNPVDIGVIQPLIDAEKHFFGHRKHRPDVYGMEWFDSRAFSSIAADIHKMVGWMASDVYDVPRYQIAFLSGGSMSGQAAYYPVAIEAIAKEQVAGAFVWNTDAYTNTMECVSADVNDGWELFTSSFTPEACRNYPPLDGRWHWDNGGTWTLSQDSFSAQYGRYTFSGLTAAGQAIKAEFTAH